MAGGASDIGSQYVAEVHPAGVRLEADGGRSAVEASPPALARCQLARLPVVKVVTACLGRVALRLSPEQLHARREGERSPHVPLVVEAQSVRAVEERPATLQVRIVGARQSDHLTRRSASRRASAYHIAPRIVALIGVHRLHLLGETHGACVHLPQTRHSAAGLDHSHPSVLGLLFQRDIDGRLVGEEQILKQFDRLMVFDHLHTPHVTVFDAAYGCGIVACHHVRPVDVEIADLAPGVLDASVGGDVEARHAFDHIGQRDVVLAGEG